MGFDYNTTAEGAATIFKDRIAGKNILITGVSPNSLGKETLRVLAPYAKTIIVASRSKERAGEAVSDVLKALPSAKVDIKIVALDLGSGASIRAAARDIVAFGIPINVVINNAAVAQPLTLTRTSDGFESQFGSNHLGHFLLLSQIHTSLSTPSRVVNVSSSAANWGGEIRYDDPSYEKRPEEYSRYPAYGISKNAGISFAVGLASKFKGKVEAFSCHPGAIRNTNMGATVPTEDLIAFGALKADGTPAAEGIFKTFETGSATQVIAAFDPSIASQSGSYLEDGTVQNVKAPAYGLNEEDAEKLWALSEKLWDVKF